MKRPVWLVVLLILCLVGSLSYGTAVLAQDEGEEGEEGAVLPDSPLYFVRQVLEDVQLALTRTPQERAEFLAQLIGRRAQEMAQLRGKGAGAPVEHVAGRLDEHLNEAEDELEEGVAEGADLSEALAALEAAMFRAREVLERVVAEVPEEARPALELAMGAVDRGIGGVIGLLERIAGGELPGSPDVAAGILERARQRFGPGGFPPWLPFFRGGGNR